MRNLLTATLVVGMAFACPLLRADESTAGLAGPLTAEGLATFSDNLDCEYQPYNALKEYDVYLAHMLNARPMNSYLWTALAELQLKKVELSEGENLDLAIENASRAVALNPPIAPAYIALAKAQIAAGDYFAAREAVQRATDLHASASELAYVQALLAGATGEFNTARAKYLAAAESASSAYAKTRILLRGARSAESNGLPEEAEALYRGFAGLPQCSEMPLALFAAFLLHHKGDAAGARAQARASLAVQANIPARRILASADYFDWARRFSAGRARSPEGAALAQSSLVSPEEAFVEFARFAAGIAVVGALLKSRLARNVNVRDGSGSTALLSASFGNNSAAATLLLDRKADPEAANSRGQRPLTYFSAAGNDAVVRRLLASGARRDGFASPREAPLVRALMNGHSSTALVLLERTVKPPAPMPELFVLAAANADAAVLSRLIQLGAVVDQRDRRGVPPLVAAILARNKQALSFLVRQGADARASFRGRSAADYARDTLDPEIIGILNAAVKL